MVVVDYVLLCVVCVFPLFDIIVLFERELPLDYCLAIVMCVCVYVHLVVCVCYCDWLLFYVVFAMYKCCMCY